MLYLAVKRNFILVFYGICRKIFFDHKCNLENDCMVKLTKIKAGELFDFFKTVNKRVSVDKKLTAGFGNVEVVFEELLDGEKGFLIEAFDGTFFEYFSEEHFAESGGKLIDKSCDAKVIVAYDGFIGIKDFSDFKSNLCFFKAFCKVFDAGCGSTDTNIYSGEEFTSESINNGTCEFFKICTFDTRTDLFYEDDIGFAYAEDEVFGFIREEILDNIENGDIIGSEDADEENNSGNIGGEAEFSCFDVDIAGKNIIKNNVFYKVCTVVFFIIILFDSCKGDSHKRAELCSKFIGASYKNCKLRLLFGTESFICKTVANMTFTGGTVIGYKEVVSFACTGKVAAGNNGCTVVNHADGTTDAVMHLVYYTLK